MTHWEATRSESEVCLSLPPNPTPTLGKRPRPPSLQPAGHAPPTQEFSNLIWWNPVACSSPPEDLSLDLGLYPGLLNYWELRSRNRTSVLITPTVGILKVNSEREGGPAEAADLLQARALEGCPGTNGSSPSDTNCGKCGVK